jgi:hypothetical protein
MLATAVGGTTSIFVLVYPCFASELELFCIPCQRHTLCACVRDGVCVCVMVCV